MLWKKGRLCSGREPRLAPRFSLRPAQPRTPISPRRADGPRCCSPLQCLSVRMLTIAPFLGTESTTNTHMQSDRPLALTVKS